MPIALPENCVIAKSSCHLCRHYLEWRKAFADFCEKHGAFGGWSQHIRILCDQQMKPFLEALKANEKMCFCVQHYDDEISLCITHLRDMVDAVEDAERDEP